MMNKLLVSTFLPTLALCFTLSSVYAMNEETDESHKIIVNQNVADNLQSWADDVQNCINKNGIEAIPAKHGDLAREINIVREESGKIIAVIKKGKRCPKDAFIYNFAESLGLKACVAPSILVGNGDTLYEKFIRVDDEYPIQRASDALQEILTKCIDSRGALTIKRAQEELSPDEMKMLLGHISHNSVEKLTMLHILTGSVDAMPQNTLVRLNEEGLLDLMLTDTEKSFYPGLLRECTITMFPLIRDYILSPEMKNFIDIQDASNLEHSYGIQIKSIFGTTSHASFFERIKFLKSTSLTDEVSMKGLILSLSKNLAEEKEKKLKAQEALDEAIIDRMWDKYEETKNHFSRNTEDKNTPLHLAAKEGQEDLMHLLLDDPELIHLSIKSLKNDQSNTPLHEAVAGGHLNVAKLLITKIPELKKCLKNQYNMTPLHIAAKIDRIDIIEWLVSEIPLLLQQNMLKDEDECTPIDWAKKSETKEYLRKLIEK